MKTMKNVSKRTAIAANLSQSGKLRQLRIEKNLAQQNTHSNGCR